MLIKKKRFKEVVDMVGLCPMPPSLLSEYSPGEKGLHSGGRGCPPMPNSSHTLWGVAGNIFPRSMADSPIPTWNLIEFLRKVLLHVFTRNTCRRCIRDVINKLSG